MISAEFDSVYSPEAFAYLFDPGQTPQRIGSVDVYVQATTGGSYLSGVTVEFIPQSGSQQVCQTTPTRCRFWSDLSPALVRASKDGYVTVEQTVTPTTNPSYPTGVTLRLSPS